MQRPYARPVPWPRRLTWAAAVLTAAVVLGGVLLYATSPDVTGALLLTAAVTLGAVSTLAGLTVSKHQPRNVLGPLLTLPGLLATIGICAALADSAELRGQAYVTAASQGAWMLVYVVIALPLLLFPDGRLASRGARWLLALIVGDALVFMVLAACAPGPYLPPNEDSPHVFGTMPALVANILTAVTLPLLPLTLIGLVVHLVRRYRASSGGLRRQFRWLALGAALLPVTVLATWASVAITGDGSVVLAIGLGLIYVSLPLLMAIAVVRPDLFDVDRVIASTGLHAALTAALLAVFTVVNALAGLVFVDAAPVLAVAAAALCAVLLAPMRARLQSRIDRWLYPKRKAAHAAIESLHEETVVAKARPEELQPRLREALHDSSLTVAYLAPASGLAVNADGAVIEPEVDGVPVMLGKEQIGVVWAGPQISVDLLRDIARRAAPLVELVRLRVELRRALQDVEDSRARLLRVGYEERARLERDLHDGAQQRLVSLGMALRLAQRRLLRGEVDVGDVLDGAVAELGTAVSELRQLAHGIRPACLDDGLVPALSRLVSSTPIPIALQVNAPGLDMDLETTAYYVAAEAITNAVKHADAHLITLDVDSRAGLLHVRVADDGVGLGANHTGHGLAGLADRVGAHGGTLSIVSDRGVGTVIEAVLPCASS